MSLITVFLADSHTILRDGLQMILERQPDIHVVGVTGDGCEAVRAVEELCPDIAILDMVLPGMDGLEAARQIGRCCPQTRVVILSMQRSPSYADQARQAGAWDYLLKEESGARIVEVVRAVHSGRRNPGQDVSEMVIGQYATSRPNSRFLL